MKSLWNRQWVFVAAVLSLTLGMFAFATPATTAQEGIESLAGAPVDIHEGTCEDYLAEPAYDGGDLEPASLLELREADDFDEDGLFEEEGILGVDVNGDEALDDTEIIGGVEEDVQVGVATTDFGEDIDFDQPLVVALHAGADTYDTVLACGSITDAAVAEDGDLVAYMHPVDNSGYFGYALIPEDGSEITTYIFAQGAAPAETPVADVEAAPGFPVAIHRGACTEWTTEPAYDVGVMQQANVAAPGEQDPEVAADNEEANDDASVDILGDDGVLNEDDEGFLREDVDDDGLFEIGLDEDDSGALEEEEILGVDEDESGALEEAELVVVTAVTVPEGVGEVYTVDTETQFDGEELIEEGPYVVAVHKSAEEYDKLVACGPVLEIVDDDKLVVMMRPVEGAETMYAGTFLIHQSEGEANGYLWPCEPYPAYVPPTPTPTPEPTPTPSPVPTAVVEETEVVEVTEVVTETQVVSETEVVLAPTATALAEQEGEPPADIIDLGEEPIGALTTQAGGTVTINNTSDTERVFVVEELGIEQVLAPGAETEIAFPDDVEAGTYGYLITEGGETLFEDELTIE